MDNFSRLKMDAIQFNPSNYGAPELAVRVGLMRALLALDGAGRMLPGVSSPDYEGFIRAQTRAYERSCDDLARRLED
ncbi:MAG: hypothetical protein AABX53_02600 [Nanoarchaeota archaeon]